MTKYLPILQVKNNPVYARLFDHQDCTSHLPAETPEIIEKLHSELFAYLEKVENEINVQLVSIERYSCI